MRAYVSCLLFALVGALLSPISASAQTDAECVAVHDSDGTRIGRWQHGSVHFEHQGRLVQMSVGISGFSSSRNVHFTEPNCTGDAYMRAASDHELLGQAMIIGNDVWHINARDVAVPVVTVSHLEKNEGIGYCVNTANFSLGVPAYTFTMPTFTPPFRLEPEPCFTPPDPDPEQIINGCVKNKNGALRIVVDPADCTSRETPITLLGQ